MRDLIKTLKKEWHVVSYIGFWACASTIATQKILSWLTNHRLSERSWVNAFCGVLATLSVQFVIMEVSAIILRVARSGEFLRFLSDPKFPQKFRCIELLWPKPVREKVWQPAFQDEVTVYNDIRKHSHLRWLNFIFACKMVYLVVITTRIAVIDWRLSLLSSKRARLSNRSRQD